MAQRGGLRIESSQNCSGKLNNEHKIPLLRETNYIVKDYDLSGDAPKQFIKAYFFKKDSCVKKANSKSWSSFIAKSAEKWYPHEPMIEYMINRIGEVIGINMNESCLVIANTKFRFLSKYFLNKDENLIHGAEICGEHLGDIAFAKEIANNKSTSRELFTFEFIKDAMRTVFPTSFEQLIVALVKLLTYDAIVGNNDRHFYNWGVIASKKKMGKIPTFAPVYDSARALLWNQSDDNIKHILTSHQIGGKKIDKYIQQANPRISIEGNTQANHFELMDFLKRYNKDYRQIINDLSSVENEEKVLKMLKKNFYPFFISARCEIITLILKTRFKKIREI